MFYADHYIQPYDLEFNGGFVLIHLKTCLKYTRLIYLMELLIIDSYQNNYGLSYRVKFREGEILNYVFLQ